MAKKYDVMNDMMSLGIHRVWKDLLLWKMCPLPGTQLLDVAEAQVTLHSGSLIMFSPSIRVNRRGS